MIGWSNQSKVGVDNTTEDDIILSAGTGKVTLIAPEELLIEFSNEASTSKTSVHSVKIPAAVATTIEVPTLKFKNVNKTMAGVDDSTRIHMHVKCVTGSGDLLYTEH